MAGSKWLAMLLLSCTIEIDSIFRFSRLKNLDFEFWIPIRWRPSLHTTQNLFSTPLPENQSSSNSNGEWNTRLFFIFREIKETFLAFFLKITSFHSRATLWPLMVTWIFNWPILKNTSMEPLPVIWAKFSSVATMFFTSEVILIINSDLKGISHFSGVDEEAEEGESKE